MAESFPDRAPEDPAEHVRQLLAVNERQTARIKTLAEDARRLTEERARVRRALLALVLGEDEAAGPKVRMVIGPDQIRVLVDEKERAVVPVPLPARVAA